MNYSTKTLKSKVKKKTLKTVENLELANPVWKYSTFVLFSLAVPWSPTVAALPLAGAKSKLHDYKQIQEKDFPKTRVSPNNRLLSDKKYQLKDSWRAEQNKRTPGPQTKQLNMELVNRKEQIDEKLKKKAFRLNLLELCSKEKLSADFSRTFEYARPRGTSYFDTQRILTIIMQAAGSFPYQLRGH